MTPPPQSDPLRLLIVEDEALIADELQHRLESLGHQVVAVCDTADSAVAAAERERPDLVLMDIRLKGAGDGIQAAERIYAQLGLPVVYLTAHSDQATFTRARGGSGIFGYLIKPVQERELVIAIEVAMQRSQLNDELMDNVLSCDTVLRELADGVLVSDERGAVRALNRAAEVLSGWAADSARGQPLSRVLALCDAEGQALAEDLPQRLATRERVELKDVRLPRADGGWRHVWVTATPVCDARGRQVGAVTVVRDTTDRVTAMDAQRASRAKTEFLSRMSHEVRTPLNAMLGFTELLASDADEQLSRRQRERLDLVMSAARHLQALVDDVMEVSLIEAGQLQMRLSPVPLAPLLDSAMDMCAELARRHGVQMLRQYQDTLDCQVLVDPQRLRQSVVNVLTNAVKYNHRGGQARVAVQAAGEHWLLQISDDGLGMTPQQLNHLFEPFNRLGRQHGTVEGTGLGLSLTRQLLQRMQADIRVRSQEGQGTQVEMHLPAAGRVHGGAVEAPPPAPAAPPAQALQGCVLYIEDNPVNTLLVEQFLSRWPGLRVHAAVDGATGLRRATELRPDLILLDMHLPDMNGLEVLRRLRQDATTRDLRVVAVSASAMADEVQRAREAGAMDYLTKPLDFKAFEQGVRRGLAALAPTPSA